MLEHTWICAQPGRVGGGMQRVDLNCQYTWEGDFCSLRFGVCLCTQSRCFLLGVTYNNHLPHFPTPTSTTTASLFGHCWFHTSCALCPRPPFQAGLGMVLEHRDLGSNMLRSRLKPSVWKQPFTQTYVIAKKIQIQIQNFNSCHTSLISHWLNTWNYSFIRCTPIE